MEGTGWVGVVEGRGFGMGGNVEQCGLWSVVDGCEWANIVNLCESIVTWVCKRVRYVTIVIFIKLRIIEEIQEKFKGEF